MREREKNGIGDSCAGCAMALVGYVIGIFLFRALGSYLYKISGGLIGLYRYCDGGEVLGIITGLFFGPLFAYALFAPVRGKKVGQAGIEVVSAFLGLLSTAIAWSYIIEVLRAYEAEGESAGIIFVRIVFCMALLLAGIFVGASSGRKLGRYLETTLGRKPAVFKGGGIGVLLGMPAGLFFGAALSNLLTNYEEVFTWWLLLGEIAGILVGWAIGTAIGLLVMRGRGC